MSGRPEATSSEERETTPLQFVLIRGPDKTLLNDEILNKYYLEDGKTPRPGYLIIGDGEREVTPEEIRAIKGRVQEGTRFDIVGHGSVKKKKGIAAKILRRKKDTNHGIHILESRGDFGDVADLIREVSDGKAVETHVWSCFGGLSTRDADRLPKGSALIAHAPEKRSIFIGMLRNGLKSSLSKSEEDLNKTTLETPAIDYVKISENLQNGSESKFFAAISGSSNRVKFRIPFNKILNPAAIKKRLKNAQEEFLNIAKRVSGKKLKIDIPDISDEKVRSIIAGSVIHKYGHKHNRTKKFLNSDKGKKFLEDFNNALKSSATRLIMLASMNDDFKLRRHLILDKKYTDIDIEEYFSDAGTKTFRKRLYDGLNYVKLNPEKMEESRKTTKDELKFYFNEFSHYSSISNFDSLIKIMRGQDEKFTKFGIKLTDDKIFNSRYTDPETGKEKNILERAIDQKNFKLVNHILKNIANREYNLSLETLEKLKFPEEEITDTNKKNVNDILNSAIKELKSPPLKNILLIGPGMPLTNEMLEKYYEKDENGKIDRSKPKDGYRVIGDGKREIDPNELLKLKGKIQEGTRIDIAASGSEKYGTGLKSLKVIDHNTKLFKGKRGFRHLASQLKKVAGDIPIEAHLWGFNSNSALKHKNLLPKGSTLITHLNESTSYSLKTFSDTYTDSLSSSEKHNRSHDRIEYAKIAKSIFKSSELGTEVGISGEEELLAFNISPEDVTNDDLLRKKLQKFASNFIELSGETTEDKIEITDDDIAKFRKTYFINAILSNKKDILKYLYSDKSNQFLSDNRNSLDNTEGDLIREAMRKNDTKLVNKLTNLGYTKPPLSSYMKYASKNTMLAELNRSRDNKKESLIEAFKEFGGYLTPEKFEIFRKEANKLGISDKDLFSLKDKDGDHFLASAQAYNNSKLVKHIISHIKEYSIESTDLEKCKFPSPKKAGYRDITNSNLQKAIERKGKNSIKEKITAFGTKMKTKMMTVKHRLSSTIPTNKKKEQSPSR